MRIYFNQDTGHVETTTLCSVGGQGDDFTDQGGGGGQPAPDSTPSNDDGMSPFDQALDNFDRQTSYPEQRPQPEQQNNQPTPPNNLLPSDPRYKAQQRGGQQPPQQTPAAQQPARGQSPVQGQQPPQSQPAPPRNPNVPPFLRADAQGNLVDERGQIVARAGGERKYYQQWRTTERALNETRTRVQTLEAENNAFRTSASAINSLGLDPRELSAAANLMSNWKTNPLEVVRYLLTQAQALGHDVSTLLGGQPSGVNPAAIRDMVRAEIAPLTQQQQAERNAQEARAASEREFQQFVEEFPEALTHAEPLANLIRANPQMTPREALFRLQAYAYQHGLDWNQPLREQIEARQNSGDGQQPSAPAQPTRTAGNRSPVPGVTPPNGQMTDMRQMNGAAVRQGATNRDIVAAAMVAAGMPDPRA